MSKLDEDLSLEEVEQAVREDRTDIARNSKLLLKVTFFELLPISLLLVVFNDKIVSLVSDITGYSPQRGDVIVAYIVIVGLLFKSACYRYRIEENIVGE